MLAPGDAGEGPPEALGLLLRERPRVPGAARVGLEAEARLRSARLCADGRGQAGIEAALRVHDGAAVVREHAQAGDRAAPALEAAGEAAGAPAARVPDVAHDLGRRAVAELLQVLAGVRRGSSRVEPQGGGEVVARRRPDAVGGQLRGDLHRCYEYLLRDAYYLHDY